MIDELLLEHVGLPHVLDLAVHLVIFGWMRQGGHSEQLLFFALFYQSTPSCLKVMGGVGWVGGPCDFSVSPWSKSFFFSFLGDFYLTWGSVGTGAWTRTWARA